MAEVGTYYITVMPDMSGFTKGVNSALGQQGAEGGKQYSGGFMDVLKGSAIGTALGNMATSAGRNIVSGLSVGIERADTLRNFPRVMEAMGYSADDAEASIKKIMERLRGLPASTQDVVRLTQAISDSTGDVGLATDAALAFTDALIANGASAGEVTQAQGVLNRVLGKQSATSAQWSSLMSVMPVQLDAVAKGMLGESASAMDLYDALTNGTVSWNDFLKAMVDVDQNGIQVAGRDMASFEEQARANSDGIGTALENLSWRIGTGWANIINAIGVENISGPIGAMADTIMNGMTKVGEAISYVKGLVDNSSIGESLSKIADAAGSFASKLWTDSDTQLVKDMAAALVDLVDGALKWLADHSDVVEAALMGIVTALGAVIGLNIASALAGAPAALTALWTAMTAGALGPFAVLGPLIAGVVAGLIWFFTETEAGQAILQAFGEFFTNLWNGLVTDFNNAVAIIKQNLADNAVQWEVFKQNVANAINAVIQFFVNLYNSGVEKFNALKAALAAIWTSITTTVTTTWNNIKTTISNTWDNIKTTASNTWNNIKTNLANTADSIKTVLTDKFNAAKDTVLNVFTKIKDGIKNKIEAARDTVANIIDRIKNLFNFSWSLPKPKLPHIEWSWTDVGGILSIPSFSVNWYAKGGIFDSASLVGIGEKGREAALPLNRRSYGEMARGIVSEMANKGGGAVVIEKIADTVVIREEADIDRIAEAINRRTRRERAATA